MSLMRLEHRGEQGRRHVFEKQQFFNGFRVLG